MGRLNYGHKIREQSKGKLHRENWRPTKMRLCNKNNISVALKQSHCSSFEYSSKLLIVVYDSPINRKFL